MYSIYQSFLSKIFIYINISPESDSINQEYIFVSTPNRLRDIENDKPSHSHHSHLSICLLTASAYTHQLVEAYTRPLVGFSFLVVARSGSGAGWVGARSCSDWCWWVQKPEYDPVRGMWASSR